MSENSSQFVAFGVGMILGAFFGAVFALLYAPEAGEELRSKIQSSASANLERANLELSRLKQTSQEKTSQPEEASFAPQTDA